MHYQKENFKTKSNISKYILPVILFVAFFQNCIQENRRLPILGQRNVKNKIVNGERITDTLYHTIQPFSLTNQYGNILTEFDIVSKIAVVDFFSIKNPQLSKLMMQVHKEFLSTNDLMILSHTTDPEHDTPASLAKYATELQVKDNKWQFLTGKKEYIQRLAKSSYLLSIEQGKSVEAGCNYKEIIVLVDKNRRIRGMYNATKETTAIQLINDIALLRKE